MKKFITALFLLLSNIVIAQQAYRPPRILFLLDGSANMLQQKDSTQTMYEFAHQLILEIVDSVYKKNAEAEFALRVYGHQFNLKNNNSYDSKLEVQFSKANLTQMDLRLADIKPKGSNAFDYGLEESITDIKADKNYKYLFVAIRFDTPKSNRPKTYDMTTIDGLLSCNSVYINLTEDNDKTQLTEEFIFHCEDALKPRDNKYSSEYGQDVIKSNITIPIVITAKEQIKTNGFGYLKIRENLSTNKFTLFFYDTLTSEYTLLEQLDITALYKGQKLKLQAGKYRLAYEVYENNKLQQNARFFSITEEMITEISLL